MLRLVTAFASLLCLATFGPVARAEADRTTYQGCCDASAAVAVDEQHFVVADDEDNILRVYRREGGSPIMEIDLNPHFGAKKTDEADIEGGAMVDDLIYWIGSHGRNAKGKKSPSRQTVIATRVGHARGGLQIEPVSKPYTKLIEDMLADDRLRKYDFEKAASRAPKDEGALNIEGLTPTPDGHLLIGFRNPIPEGKAIILPLLNPRELFTGGRAKFGDPVELDLNGLGIRSLGFHEGRCLIIAGHYAEGGRSHLFEWKPGETVARPLKHIKLGGLNPEGMSFATVGGAPKFLVVSDDGTRMLDGKDCKDLKPSLKRFRGIVLQL